MSRLGDERGSTDVVSMLFIVPLAFGVVMLFVFLGRQGSAAEGVTHIDHTAPYLSHRRPAFEAVRRFVERWPSIPGWRALQRAHERQSEVAGALAGRAELHIQGLTRMRTHAVAAMRSERGRLARARAAAKRCRRRTTCSARESRRLGRLVGRREVRLRHLRLAVRGIDAQLRTQRLQASDYRRQELVNYFQALDYGLRIGG